MVPSLLEFFGSWHFAVAPFVVAGVASGLYLVGLRVVHMSGRRWPSQYVWGFFGLGISSYVVVEFGFLGEYSSSLRWAFVTRIVFLLFFVPLAIATGRPLDLLRMCLGEVGQRTLDGFIHSRAIRIVSNAMFGTLFTALLLSVFLTPLSGILRTDGAAQSVVDIALPAIGLMFMLPLTGAVSAVTTTFIAIEFLLVFAELLIDGIPGIALRLQNSVVDGIGNSVGLQPWWPSALRDQQLAGDALWAFAEFADLPILILILIRWVRSDRRDSQSVDELSDEQYGELTKAYMQGELHDSFVRSRSTTAPGASVTQREDGHQ